MAFTQAEINAALAAELAARPTTSAYDLAAYAMQTYGITPAQIDTAYQSLNVAAAPSTIDYERDYGGAPTGTYRAATETGYSGPSQKVTDPTTGKTVELFFNAPGFNPTDPTTLKYLGGQKWSDPNSYGNLWYNEFATPSQKAAADSLWEQEWKRLNAQDLARETPGAIASGKMPASAQVALKIEADAKAKAEADAKTLADKTTTGLFGGQITQQKEPPSQLQTTLVTQAISQTEQTARGANQEKSQAAPKPSAVPAGFIESLTAIPNVTDQQIVAAMKAAKVSPKNLADALGINEGEVVARVAGTVSNGQSVQLGDTIVQPKYRVTGSGETQEIGPLENVYSYRASDNQAGGGYTQYNPDGTFQRSGTQVKVNATKDFVKFVLTAGAIFGSAALAGFGPTVQAVGLTAAEAAGLGLTATEAASLGFTGTQLAAAGYTAADITAAGLSSTSATALTTAITTDAAAAATQASTIASSTGGLLTAAQVTKLLASGLTADNISKLVSGGLLTGGSLLQQQTSKEATEKAQKTIETETAAAKAAAGFRPVGMTTRFGTSAFTTDPVTGQLTSAGYTASPGVLEAQNRLVALGNQGLAQAEGAQAQFAPLQTGAQSLFNLGNQYLAQSPEAVAQNYLNQQMALLQPGRELELANLQNKLQQQGRGGLAVAQGGNLGATTPELQALYNARAQQEAQLAANAQQYGQQQVLYGAGLLGQGANAMGGYYAGQQSAYAPYTTALGQFQNLEQLAQQPLTLSAGLAQQSAQAGTNVAKLGLTGAQLSTNLATSANATANPYAQALMAAGNPNSAIGQVAGGLLTNYLGSPTENILSSSAYGPGVAGFQNMLADIYG